MAATYKFLLVKDLENYVGYPGMILKANSPKFMLMENRR